MSELAESLRLYLTDTLSCDVEFLTYFFQGVRTPVIKTESQDQDFLFTL